MIIELALTALMCGNPITLLRPATSVRVIDGDTIVADVSLGLGLTIREKLRFSGINAYERREKLGPAATDYVKRWVKRPFGVVISKRGKYGRPLAVLIDYNGRTLNSELVSAGLAVYKCY